MTEEEIAGLFERVARDLDVPGVEALVGGAARSGRRLRQRHLASLAAGSVLAAGAIVVVGTTWVVPRLTGAPGPAGAVTPGSPASATAVASTHTSSAPPRTASASVLPVRITGTAAASPKEAMTATQIMADLRAMLPATSTFSDIQDTSAKIWNKEAPAVEFNYNDGKGEADVQFGIYGPSSLLQDVLDCSVPTANASPRPPGAPPVSCAKKTLPGGSQVVDVVTATDNWGFYDYEIDVVRPDGVTISLAIGNGTLPSKPVSNGIATPAVTRAVPPGSFAQWNAIAESPVWHS
jgi:hypothetical protein